MLPEKVCEIGESFSCYGEKESFVANLALGNRDEITGERRNP
jgi:hypothetical protein